MIKKSLLIWLTIIPLAILNGGMREMVINPLIGARFGLPLSGVLLCVLVFVLCWFCIPRIGRGTTKVYLLIGLWWIVLTVLFETVFGLLIGNSFTEVINAYNMTTGNIWLLVVLFIGIAPWLSAKTRRLI